MVDFGKSKKILTFSEFLGKSNYRIGIYEPRNFFDVNFMTELVPGYINEITIKPTKTDASKDIEDVSPLRRNCRFSHELPKNMTLFKNYSMAACQFECMINVW